MSRLGEAYWMSGEAACRTNIDLPGVQQALAEAVHATGKPVITIIMSGRPLTINWLVENNNAFMQPLFLGTTSGQALAEVLVGDYNPSGKLSMTFPQNVGQIPIHYNMKNTGRPFLAEQKYTSKYLDVPNEPLFAFGYGLSYTSFEYSDIKMNKATIAENETIEAMITVKNKGKYAGEEVVQMYIQDPVASVSRPVKELKGFNKIMLQPGESQTLRFTIGIEELSFYRADMSWGAEKGIFNVMIGGSSDNTLQTSFELN